MTAQQRTKLCWVPGPLHPCPSCTAAHTCRCPRAPPAPQVRTQTLVKGAIVQVDAAPFKAWYSAHYGAEVGVKKRAAAGADAAAKDAGASAAPAAKKSNHAARKIKTRSAGRKLDPALDDQMANGRLYAAIASRPGQCGRCDGYILEGKELEFYVKKMQRKKSKA